MSEKKSKINPDSTNKKNLRDKVKHAFAVNIDDEPLSVDDEALLEKAAKFIARRRLNVPATMALEVMTPISFLSSQAMVVLEPLLGPFFPREDYKRVIKILARRDGLKIFIQRIENATSNISNSKN